MPTKRDPDRLFRRALDLYLRGRHAEAGRIFRKVAAARRDFASLARRFLVRLKTLQGEKRKAKQASGRAGIRGVARKAVKRRARSKSIKKAAERKRKKGAPGKPKSVWLSLREYEGLVAGDYGFRYTESPPVGTPASAWGPRPTIRSTATLPLVQRTPHIDIRSEVPLAPGVAFEVEVYVDKQAAHDGEEAADVIVPAGAYVQVFLFASAHFTVMAPVQLILISADVERSAAPVFHLEVKSAGELPADDTPSYITALFMLGGRPCGSVRRQVEIVGVASRMLPPSPARIEVKSAKHADLQITIVAPEGSDGRNFSCVVQTPLLDQYKTPVLGRWSLQSDPGKLVHTQMNEFTKANQTPQGRIAALRGAGIEFFKAAPPIFKKVFWDLIDAGRPPRDISVTSQEPFIPWELMIPQRGLEDARQPLGVEFRVGRWTAPDIIAPNQKIMLSDSYVIAPKYNDKRDLKFAPAEAEMVVKAFSGESIQPVVFAEIEQKFRTQVRSLVHFVCHGKDNRNGLVDSLS